MYYNTEVQIIDRTTGRSRQKDMTHDLPPVPLELMLSSLCCASCGSSCTLIDRCLVQSAVSNLFSNQWRCLKLYLPLPVCLICRCVFWLVIMFSGLLLCFLNCYFVFFICICVCNLLFCFLNRDLFCTSRPPYISDWCEKSRAQIYLQSSTWELIYQF